jgi:hypothetical protein
MENRQMLRCPLTALLKKHIYLNYFNYVQATEM